jgi:hypothetical protein
MGIAPKCCFSQDSLFSNPEIPEILKIGTLATLVAYNVLCKPLIDMRFKAKLSPSLRNFQQYVARPLYGCNSRQYPTFNG